MTKAELLPYVSYVLDDALSPDHQVSELVGERLDRARLVGWQCGFEPLVVAVISYLPGIVLDEADAEDIARDYLEERGWFLPDGPRDADFVI